MGPGGWGSLAPALVGAGAALLAAVGTLLALPWSRRKLLSEAQVSAAQARKIDADLTITLTQEARAMLAAVGDRARHADERAEEAEARAAALVGRLRADEAELAAVHREVRALRAELTAVRRLLTKREAYIFDLLGAIRRGDRVPPDMPDWSDGVEVAERVDPPAQG